MSGARVLIVDDDRSFVDAVAIYLEDHGFRVSKAYCGKEGLREARRRQFDLALLDLHLPDMEGTEVALDLRNREPSVAILMVSSDDSSEAISRCAQGDAQMFMAKPLMPKQLLETICRMCERAQVHRTA